jgi:alpha-ribazole phosphatase
MSDMKEISFWLVRHAPVGVTMIYGQQDLDAELTDRASFEWLAAQLPNQFTAVASDLIRCRQTLDEIRELGATVELTKVSKELREQSFGAWEGLTYEEARAHDPQSYLRFWENPVENAPPSGESFLDLCHRTSEYFSAIALESEASDIVFVIHAGTIRAILAQALQIEPAQSQLFDIGPLSLTRLTVYRQEGVLSWKIDCVNKTRS